MLKRNKSVRGALRSAELWMRVRASSEAPLLRCMCRAYLAPSLSSQGRGPHGSSPWAALRGWPRPAPFRRSGTPTADGAAQPRTAAPHFHHSYLIHFFIFFVNNRWRSSWALREHLLGLEEDCSILISECCSAIHYASFYWLYTHSTAIK